MKKLFVFFWLVVATLEIYSQDKVLMTIGDVPVYKSEFVRIYKKNNQPNSPDRLSVDEYLDLFVNYKLKVIDAEKHGYDTAKAFNDEYKKYVRIIAENYYPDSLTLAKLIDEAYNRLKTNVRVSYIVLFLPKDGDTSETYKKALEIRKKALDGEDFTKLALEYSQSKTVKQDSGDAWYQEPFKIPASFEEFIYTHKVGDISMPIMHNKAYYILKITDKRPALGDIRVSHIYIRLPFGASEKDSLKAMEKIKKIRAELDSGADFADLARKYSDFPMTASKGGDLGWISVSAPIDLTFKKAAYALKNPGDYTKTPIRLANGYHFILLTDKKQIGTLDKEKDRIIKELKKSGKYQQALIVTTERLKKQYNFEQLLPLDSITKKVTDKIFTGTWKADTFANDTRPLIKFADKIYTVADFGKYLERHQRLQQPKDLNQYIQKQFQNFVIDKIKAYELDKLPDKIPQLKALAQEYHDGILLFNILQDSVSNKSVKDTAGLRAFYEQHKLDYYKRLNLEIYSYSTKKGRKLALKYLKKGFRDSALIAKVSAKDTAFKLYKKQVFKEGDDKVADKVFEMYKNKQIAANQKIVVLNEDKKIVLIKDNLKYNRGFVLADYQNYLEKQWVDRLKKRYPVKINQDVLDEIKKELSQE